MKNEVAPQRSGPPTIPATPVLRHEALATRRGLGLAALALPLPPAGADASPAAAGADTELLTLCARARAADAAGAAIWRAGSGPNGWPTEAEEVQADAHTREYHALVDRIVRMEPRTPAGLRAIARLTLDLAGGAADGGPTGDDDQLPWALARAVLMLAGDAA